MKTAIYVRVSTDDKGQDPRNQLRQLREFARKQERWTVVQEYVDHATGRNGDRRQFQAMMRDASRRKFDVLLFWDLSRLTREGIWKTLCYLRQLSDAGVEVQELSAALPRHHGHLGRGHHGCFRCAGTGGIPAHLRAHQGRHGACRSSRKTLWPSSQGMRPRPRQATPRTRHELYSHKQ